MLVVLVIAGLAVIACVVMVSLGRGGEMAEFPPDVPPLDLPAAGQLTPADLIALQLPISLVGYSTQAVDETLHRVSVALGERDTRIAVLEQRVAELLSGRLQARNGRGTTAGDHAGKQPESLTDSRPDLHPGSRAEVPSAATREGGDGGRPDAADAADRADASDAEETW